MKSSFASAIRCLDCRGELRLEVSEESPREVREGRLVCQSCAAVFPIVRGIPDFVDPDDRILADEVAGWVRLAGPLGEHLDPVMAALPSYPGDPWPLVAPDFFQIFEDFDFAGKRVVDLGAGRTWSTRHLVALGKPAEAVAVDIMTDRYLGLETAELFFAGGIFFERLRADGHRLPLVDAWADVVFSCAAIHHSSDLDRLFAEVHRVLRPGGLLLFVSEPSKREAITWTKPQNEETAVGINENVYSLAEYRRALRRAGFSSRRLLPRSLAYRLRTIDPETGQDMPRFLVRWARTERGRRFLLWALGTRTLGDWLYRWWSLPLSMAAVKNRS